MPPHAAALRRALPILLLAALIALIAYYSPVTSANADPHFSLVVSQSLIENQTLQLDAYRRAHPRLFEEFHWQLTNIGGHLYYNYPLAPSIVALPAVAAARLLGLDMLIAAHNHLLQNLLSALLCALIFILVFLVVRSYLPYRPALLIALISTLGSTLFSTVATAYWNLGVAVLFVLLALLLLSRFDAGLTRDPRPYLLGLILFAAYFTRPSAAIFILAVFLYLLLHNRPALLRAAATASLGFAAFIAFSRLQYGLWLPTYYTAAQWFDPQGLLRPLYGVTFSPSRGLFTFSPFFLLTLFGGLYLLPRRRSRERDMTLYWLCALWLALQLLAVALTPQWHGGFSFGPRLLTDAVPALALMSAILWRDLAPQLPPPSRRLAALAYLLLGLFAIFVHTIQGPFNVKAAFWNAYPNVDQYPQLLFDWRYPQFLTTVANFHERRLSFHEAQLAAGDLEMAPYEWSRPLSPTLQATHALWHGWWPDAAGEWWAETPLPTVIIPIPPVDPQRQYALEIEVGAATPRLVRIALNGRELGEMTVTPARQRAQFIFDAALLEMHNTARITMSVPDLYRTPQLTAFTHAFSYTPHELGLRSAVVRLAPLPEN